MDEMTTYQQDLLRAATADLPWHKLNGSNILVVGATGLIGGCVVDLLMRHPEANYSIYAGGRNRARALKRFASYSDEANFHFMEIDVTKPIDSDIHFQFIIDAASGANPKLYSVDPVGVMKSNFNGVDNLLSYGWNHGLKRFVYVSSGEVYGESDGRKFTEDYSGYVDSTKFRSCYPSSKRAAETLCASYAHQYGLSVVIARPSHVYGPYFTESDTRVYAQFLRNVLRGEDIVMKSTGSQFRSWCYVVDCASALMYLLLKGQDGEAYNIADDSSNVSVKHLAELIARLAGKKVIMELPDADEKAGFSVIRKAIFDTSKLESLGWQVSGSLRSKLLATIEELR